MPHGEPLDTGNRISVKALVRVAVTDDVMIIVAEVWAATVKVLGVMVLTVLAVEKVIGVTTRVAGEPEAGSSHPTVLAPISLNQTAFPYFTRPPGALLAVGTPNSLSVFEEGISLDTLFPLASNSVNHISSAACAVT